MDTTLTIAGWIVTFVLGIAATIVTQTMLRKRKMFDWVVSDETNLSPHIDPAKAPVPVKILVGGREEDSLHSVTVRLRNSGNVELENIAARISFGANARVVHWKFANDLGLWEGAVSTEITDAAALVRFKHINVGQDLTLNFLVSSYQAGNTVVDMSELGVQLRQIREVATISALGLTLVSVAGNKAVAAILT